MIGSVPTQIGSVGQCSKWNIAQSDWTVDHPGILFLSTTNSLLVLRQCPVVSVSSVIRAFLFFGQTALTIPAMQIAALLVIDDCRNTCS
jgi:hypothetical protein